MYFNATPRFLRKLIIPVLVFIALTAPSAWATSGIKTRFLTAYGLTTTSRLATINGVSHCGACHFQFSSGSADIGNLNPYGVALQGNTSTTTAILAIGSQDSDGDGFSNDNEIKGTGYANIPTFPGLKSSNVNLVGSPSGITLANISGFLTPGAAMMSGGCRVTLGPAAAVTAGAQWRVDGGAWQNSDATVTGLLVGSHAITYKAVTGWTVPASESISITNGMTMMISRTYTQQTGSLRVTLGPASAVAVGAQWNVDGGAWQNSAATVTGLSVGSHVITYKTVSGWTPPASESVSINNGITTASSRIYKIIVQPAGSLRVTLGPPVAAALGAKWSIDGGAWQNSAATVTGLSVGSHEVTYKAMNGWTAPASETVSITNAVTTAVSRNYALLPLGKVILVYRTTLMISPSAFRDLDDPNTGWKTGINTATAWMVIDVNLADPNADNIQAALIPFGRGIDPNDGIVKQIYVNDAVLDINAFSVLPGLELPPAKARPDVFLVDFKADNIVPQWAGVGIVDARMQGTTIMIKTSPTESGDVAMLLKGTAIYDSIYDDTFAGSGAISATLNPLWTKRANDPAEFAGVFTDVVAGIKAMLESTRYTAVTQTP